MDINEKLKQAGLTGNESKVYLELVKKGKLSANQLAKNLSLDRTLTYTILNNLVGKGQVSYTIKGNKKFFNVANPENLLNKIKSKEIIVLDLIKELNKIKSKKQVETDINIYEGPEGIRILMKLMFKEKELLSFGGTGRAYDLLYEAPAFAKQLEKIKFPVKVITQPSSKAHEFTKFKNVKTKFLDINSEATTSILGDYVSIHLIKDKPIIILIKNKHIAQSYRNYFNFLWKQANN